MLEIGLAIIALGAFSFAAKDMASKNALQKEAPMAANFYINLFSFSLSFLYLLISGIPPIPQSALFPSIIVGAGLAFGTIFFFRALKEERASIVGPLGTLWTFGVIVLAVLFFGKPISTGTALGALLAFIGMLSVALLQKPKITLNLVLAILIWSSWVFAAEVIDAVGPIAALCLFSFFCALFSLPGIAAKKPLRLVAPGALNFLAFLSDVTATAMLGIVIVSSLLMPLYFVFIALGCRIFFHEKISSREAIGLALVCIGITVSSVFSQ